MRHCFVAGIWLLQGCLIAGTIGCAAIGSRDGYRAGVKIRSITLDARRDPGPEALEHLRDVGVTHITLVQFGFQRDMAVPQIRMNPDANWFSESDDGIRLVAARAAALHMDIILKPHIWVGGYSVEGQTRAEIGYATETEWRLWESDYRQFMLHYARLAEETGAAMLVIGTELSRAALERAEFWRDLAGEVRTIYGGPLTYAANWWGEYEHVPFWDALDYIGIQAYFELSQETDPSTLTLREAWMPHKEAIQRLSREVQRPVLFTEIGYRNVPDAAAKPWRWPSRDEPGAVEPADELQARLYDVFFASFWDEPWFAGAIIWKWNAHGSRRSNYLDFSLRGKPAAQVVKKWFGAAAEQPVSH